MKHAINYFEVWIKSFKSCIEHNEETISKLYLQIGQYERQIKEKEEKIKDYENAVKLLKENEDV